MTLKPGKGLHTDFSEGLLSALRAALDEISSEYTDEDQDDGAGKAIQDQLVEFRNWKIEEDKFGRKCYKSIPWADATGKGEIRVTLVVTPRNQMKLDIRYWYDG